MHIETLYLDLLIVTILFVSLSFQYANRYPSLLELNFGYHNTSLPNAPI